MKLDSRRLVLQLGGALLCSVFAAGHAGAASVLLVGRDNPGPTNGSDADAIAYLESFGANTVTYAPQDAVPASLAGFDAVVVSSTVQTSVVNSGSIPQLFSAPQGVLYWEWGLVDDFGMATAAAQTGPPSGSTHMLNITNPADPLAAGATGVVDLGWGSTVAFANGPLGGGVSSAAERDGDSARLTLLSVPTGGALLSGTAPGPRVFFPLGNGTVDDMVALNGVGLDMFNASLEFVGITVPVPEPATVGLIAWAIGTIGFARCRRN